MMSTTCDVFCRHEAAYVISQARTVAGWLISGDTIIKVGYDSPQALGAAVLEALQAFQQNVPESEDHGVAIPPLVTRVGFKTWNTFEKGALYLLVSCDRITITVTPTSAAHRRGFEFLPDKAATCRPEPEEIGQTLLDRLAECSSDGATQVRPSVPGVSVRIDRTNLASNNVAQGRQSPNWDQPVGFGYKIAWLAIPTDDTQAVVAALHLEHTRPSNWVEGIRHAYEAHVFVSPAVSIWTLVVSASLPPLNNPTWLSLLLTLSKAFGEVQYFATDRVVEYHAWAKVTSGRIVRAYAYLGERGETLCNIGDETREEIEVTHILAKNSIDRDKRQGYPQQDAFRRPNEELVMQLAERWSIDPTQIDTYESEGLGILGDPSIFLKFGLNGTRGE